MRSPFPAASATFVFLTALALDASAAPPPPSGAHPRIWLTAPTVTALKAKMGTSGTKTAAVIARCRDIEANPSKYGDGIYAGYGFAYNGSACALAYRLTGDAAHATAALTFFHALLQDYNSIGDGAGGPTAEQHDGGYSMRYFGAFTAILYDWLHDAPGADPAMFDRARTLFKTWVEWYEKDGYLKDAPGSNYHAGYLFAKTMIAIAASGEDDGSAAKYWADVVDNLFAKELVQKGLTGKNALAGGDWPEGWEYGPLGVLEYALSARALEEQGVAQPEARTWASDLVLHFNYALTPDQKGFLPAGDWGTSAINAPPSQQPLLAAMAGPASDEAAGWAAYLHQNAVKSTDECLVYEALAEARGATATSFSAKPRSGFYVTAGTRKVYARSSWDPGAYWTVFMSTPKFGVDHQHLDASNFVLSRGADAVIADPSPYGSLSTLTGNALSVDSQTVQDNYRPSQSPHSLADLPWARATESGVAAARADLAGAFADDTGKSDVPFARRDWAFLPEGEVVAIDRVRTDAAGRNTYLRFRSPGAFTLAGGNVATANVGGSKAVVHAVTLSGGAPSVRTLKGNSSSPCDSGPFGVCDAARFNAGEYAVKIPGPAALAVHVIDALAAQEAPAEAVAIGDPAVVGARVTRGSVRTFVVASSAKDGAAGANLAYSADGDRAARHVVFDAPENADGKSNVATKADGAKCAISITAGGALAGRPLVFDVSSASDGCKVTEEKGVVPAGTAPGGSGGPGSGDGAGGPGSGVDANAAGSSKGCGCRVRDARASDGGTLALIFSAAALVIVRSRRRR